jgi:hypothetical protein
VPVNEVADGRDDLRGIGEAADRDVVGQVGAGLGVEMFRRRITQAEDPDAANGQCTDEQSGGVGEMGGNVEEVHGGPEGTLRSVCDWGIPRHSMTLRRASLPGRSPGFSDFFCIKQHIGGKLPPEKSVGREGETTTYYVCINI